MKVKGICKDCSNRHHMKSSKLFCTRLGGQHFVKNPSMKGCPFYEKANDVRLDSMSRMGWL